jgi:endonuclease-3
MNHPPIRELVKDPNWQRIRNSLIGKWTSEPDWCLNQLRSFLGNIKSSSDYKLLIVSNYMSGTGFRTGRISSKKNPGIGKLRGIISAEIKRRKYKGIFEQVNTEEKRRQFEIFKRLSIKYPNAFTSLKFKNPFELLVVTILSAMSTDKKANEVGSIIFSKYSISDLANIPIQELEKIVYPCGFYHQKSNSIKNCAIIILRDYRGKVPNSMIELLKLPGVSRKTANIVLSAAYGIIEGIAVDVHTFRVARRLELSLSDNTNKVEQDLMSEFPKETWPKLHWTMVSLGREICTSRNPKHHECPLYDVCPNNNI